MRRIITILRVNLNGCNLKSTHTTEYKSFDDCLPRIVDFDPGLFRNFQISPPTDSGLPGVPAEDDSPSRRLSSSGINRNVFTQPQRAPIRPSTRARIRGDNLHPGNLRRERRPWRLQVLVSGLPEDCLRTEGRIKNSMVRHLFCSPISIVPTHHRFTIQTNSAKE
ncbi:hypothetical protein F5888DRAFT_613410 [Russula emetica]|nr:hypothetical protein F5888DRAFT_613410 [Russula emetica]